MATYVVGDLQGCAESLKALLKRCRFGPHDRLWCVGDLVNRGPHSLEVLDLLMSLGDRARVVLGNHDLHLLACSEGADTSRGDTLDEVLAHPARERYLSWLLKQPLLYEGEGDEAGLAMLHAGFNPTWSWPEVKRRARRAEQALRAPNGLATLARFHPSRKRLATDKGEPPEWLHDLAWLTRVRFITGGQVNERIKGGPSEGGDDDQPWYEVYEDRLNGFSHHALSHHALSHEHTSSECVASGDQQGTQQGAQQGVELYPKRLFVGHWAALGLYKTPRLVALDTGCIWGRYLTALRLEDDAIFQQSTIEYALVAQHQRGDLSAPQQGKAT